eukprot:8133207-Karenia_brevis.AAC.1
MRPADSEERGVLMEFPRHHTCTTCLLVAEKPRPFTWVRCAWSLEHWERAAELVDKVQSVADTRCEQPVGELALP